MPKHFRSEDLARLYPLLETFRESSRDLRSLDQMMRNEVEQIPRETIPVEVLQIHIAMLEKHFVRMERMYHLLLDSQLDDPVSVEFIRLYGDRLNNKDDLLGFWNDILASRLS